MHANRQRFIKFQSLIISFQLVYLFELILMPCSKCKQKGIFFSLHFVPCLLINHLDNIIDCRCIYICYANRYLVTNKPNKLKPSALINYIHGTSSGMKTKLFDEFRQSGPTSMCFLHKHSIDMLLTASHTECLYMEGDGLNL